MALQLTISSLAQWYQGTPDRQRRRIGMGILVFCFFAIFGREFIADRAAVKTVEQVEFESYVEQYQHALSQDKDRHLPVPRVELRVNNSEGVIVRRFLIEPSPELDEKVGRVLQVACEARVFGLSSDKGGEVITLVISKEDKIFQKSFSRAQVAKNYQAELLFKLVSIHGKSIV